MKKKVLISAIVSFVINAVLFLINLICAYSSHTLPLAKRLVGGECIEHIGFGVRLLEIFSFSREGSGGTSYKISFDFISILIPLVVIFVLALVIGIIVDKAKNK